MKNDVTDEKREGYNDSVPRLDAGGGGIDWNNPITRRRFLKRTGGATAATMLALHGMRVEMLAQAAYSATQLQCVVYRYWRYEENGKKWIQILLKYQNKTGGNVAGTLDVHLDGCASGWPPAAFLMGQTTGNEYKDIVVEFEVTEDVDRNMTFIAKAGNQELDEGSASVDYESFVNDDVNSNYHPDDGGEPLINQGEWNNCN